LNLAAIDIGSNAVRLLIIEVNEEVKGKPEFNKINFVRVPLRLGFDVFEKGEIGEHKIYKLVQTIKSFAHLLNVYDVKHVKAAATSAMRDAKNGKDIVKHVLKETDIEIEILTGDREAALINQNHIAEKLDKVHSYLYIDVGGGSTELTFFDEGRMKYRESFNIGTIRLLKGQVTESNWTVMRDHLKQNTKSELPITAIGSGGNINKIFSLSKKKDGKPLSLQLLRDFHKELSSQSLHDLINIYKLKADRADVIVPALLIYINIMRWADISEIYVPKIGLADGLINALYEKIK